MPSIAAGGSTHIPLFVFKGSRIPFRQVVVNGVTKLDSYAERLPRGALVTVRENTGGVDTTNFYSWALQFVSLVKGSHGMNRKVLLIYDGYRHHDPAGSRTVHVEQHHCVRPTVTYIR